MEKEFLHQKVLEFGENKEKMNQWIENQFSKTTEANVNEIGENHFLILKNLFPDSDSEFLHQKAIEFSEDKEKMNQWIEQQFMKTESKNSLKILESMFPETDPEFLNQKAIIFGDKM